MFELEDEFGPYFADQQDRRMVADAVGRRLGWRWNLGGIAWMLCAAVPTLCLVFAGQLGPYYIAMPIALCTLVTWLMLWTFIYQRPWRRAMRLTLNEYGKAKLCIMCGYNVRDLPGPTSKCPECGTEIAPGPSMMHAEPTAGGPPRTTN